MGNTRLIFCLLVVAGAWAKPDDGCDLNLKSIFRTPKDFSKVNFDHFELLERNNFDDESKSAPSTKTETIDLTKSDDRPSKPTANAQVMLRIGGEDIHDCNRVVLHSQPPIIPKSADRPMYPEYLPQLSSNDIRYPCYSPQTYYHYYPTPPTAYPGGYYNPGTIPNYMPSSYQTINGQMVPNEFVPKAPQAATETTEVKENYEPSRSIPNYMPSSYQTINGQMVPTEFVPKAPQAATETTEVKENYEPSRSIPNYMPSSYQTINGQMVPTEFVPKAPQAAIETTEVKQNCLEPPRSIPNYMPSSYQTINGQMVPTEFVPNSPKPVTEETEGRENCLEAPGTIPNYMPSSYQTINGGQVVPSEFVPKTPERVIQKIEEGVYLIEPSEENTAVHTENANPQLTLENTNTCNNEVQQVGIVDVPKEPCSNAPEEKIYITKPELEPTVADTSCTVPPIKEVSTPECINIKNIHTTTTHPNSLPPNLAYVEVNLSDLGKHCSDTSKDNIGTFEHEFSQKHPHLKTYPVVKHEETVCTAPQEEIVATKYINFNNHASCDSCNQERNPNIPYGQRFSKDVDSLFEIVDNRPAIQVPSTLCNEAAQINQKRITTVVPAVEEVVEENKPCRVTIEPPCLLKEEVQETSPCSSIVSTIESPCERKSAHIQHSGTAAVPPVSHYQTQWSTQNLLVPQWFKKSHASPETFTVVQPPCAKIEKPTLNSAVEATVGNWQSFWPTQTIEQPWQQREVVQTAHSYPGTVESPCATQKVYPVSNSYYDILNVFKKIAATAPAGTTFQTEWPTQQTFPKPCPLRNIVQTSPWSETTAALPGASKNVKEPLIYSSGCSKKSDTHYSVELTKYGNEQPKVYVDGCKATSGSGYYGNPVETVYYKQPTVVETLRNSNPLIPVAEHAKYIEPSREVSIKTHPFLPILGPCNLPCSTAPVSSWPTVISNYATHQHKTGEPHIYKIVAKYDIVPRGDIKPLNIPDLVPTNQYLKVNVPTTPPRHVCREFVPSDLVPFIKNVYYIPGWPFLRNVPVQREVPLAPNYTPVCRTCAKYRGELAELSSAI